MSAPSHNPLVERRPTDEWRGWILWGVLFACAPVFSHRSLSFQHPKEMLLALGLVLAAGTVVWRGRFTFAGIRAFLPVWAFLIFVAVVHIWGGQAQVPEAAITETVRLIMFPLAGALLFDLTARPRWRERLADAFALSAVATALLGLAQYAGLLAAWFPVFPSYTQRMYSVFGNQDDLGGYLAMAMPLLAYRFLTGRRHPMLSLMALAPIAAALVLSGSRSAWGAAAAGTVIIIPWNRRGMGRTTILGLLGMLLLLLAWRLDADHLEERVRSAYRMESTGIRARLWFWDGAVRMIREHPIAGVGPGNYAYWSPRYQGDALAAPGGETHYHNEVHTRRAHSDYLEALTTGGAIGSALLLLMALLLVRRRGWAWGPLTALLVFSLANSANDSAPHMLGGILFASMLLARNHRVSFPDSNRWLGPALYAGAIAVLLFHGYATVQPSVRLKTADTIRQEEGSALDAYQYAVEHPWAPPLAHRNHAIALLDEERFPEAEEAFRKALEGLDTGDLYLALGALAHVRGDHDAARKYYEDCLHRWPSHIGAWNRLRRLTPAAEQEALRERASLWLDTDGLAAAGFDAPPR